MTEGRTALESSGESLRYLTDAQLCKGIDAMFFAYRGFSFESDRILAQMSYGRAHHRALHFINRVPGTTINNLLSILGVSKQSLNRVLRALIQDGLVVRSVGENDRRNRNLFLTESGTQLEKRLFNSQCACMSAAYREAGPEAVAGFRTVLEALMGNNLMNVYARLNDGDQ